MEGELRQEMLAAWCLARGGEEGRALFRFVDPEKGGELERLSKKYLSAGNSDEVRDRIENLVRVKRRLGLEEMHPGWILEHLRGESPRFLSLLSNFISPQKSEYILNHLNFESRRLFLKAGREVHPDLLDALRILIEKKVGSGASPKLDGGFGFYHLSCLSGDDLKTLFRELGLGEIGLAFSGVRSGVLRAFLTRFPLKDAREIRSRVKSEEKGSVEECRRAKRHLLSLSFGSVSTEGLLQEIGYSLFIQALDPDKIDWARSLCQKLPVTEGYRLRRFLQEKRSERRQGDPELRERILADLRRLAVRGKVRRYWKEEREIESTSFFKEEGAS